MLAAEIGDADALLVTAPTNVRYLTGFTGSNGSVLIDRAGPDRLYTDPRYTARAEQEAPGIAVEIVADALMATLPPVAGRRLAVEARHLDWHRAQRLQTRAAAHHVQIVATTGMVERLRRIKDANEIEQLREACRITTSALATTMEELRPGVTERETAVSLERRMIDLGAEAIAFPSIVASGPNGAIPHHTPTERRIGRRELVTIDCGAVVGGYHADCTRTVAVGEPSPQLHRAYEVVRHAQESGRDAVRTGRSISQVDAACRAVIDEAGFAHAFVHPTGHGVGLDVHEWPTVADGVHATIEPGMVLTVEPGVYLAEIGGVRIEDTIAVLDDGLEVLTDLPREL
ncbi:MAG: Xaa-Pro peptidase family protein [Nitriliruptoraceae bacterium]